ncbi:MAG: hypothetical protein WC712_11285 [Candidatus Brocadiia bacterium]
MSFTERPFFISSPGPLCAVLTDPDNARASMQVVTGFGEEKKSSYRNMVELCRAAASQGIRSLRFDLSGTGDSDADFGSLTLDRWSEDIAAAFDYLQKLPGAGRVSCVALRLGCLLASACNISWESAVLIAPPMSGAAYMREVLLQKQLRAAMTGSPRMSIAAMEESIARDGSLDLDGIKLGHRMFEGLRGLAFEQNSQLFKGRGMIVSFGANPSQWERAASACFTPEAGIVSLQLAPFWNQNDFLSSSIMNGAIIGHILNEVPASPLSDIGAKGGAGR